MRGNAPTWSISTPASGTSPHTRRKLKLGYIIPDRNRNIPAYAEKTPSTYIWPGLATEHPRICGENQKVALGVTQKDGTSPHMRGKPREQGWLGGCREEHPRVCGENWMSTQEWGRAAGTSPRMRGKHEAGLVGDGDKRNIPAYAGKTRPVTWPPTSEMEHPRVCGENVGGEVPGVPHGGTSPRMRGKRLKILLRSLKPRNIPAYAGKTVRDG